MVRVKASVEQTKALAFGLYQKGVKSNEVVERLKASGYTLRGVYFNASAVAWVVAGLEMSQDLPKPKRSTKPKA